MPISFVKRPKYRNRSSYCPLKHWHQSILEADHCAELQLLKKAGEIKDFKSQYPIDLVVNGVRICGHIVDFLVTDRAGKDSFVEVKGMETDVWKIKKKLTETLFPNIPYVVKKAKPTYFVNRRFACRNTK